MLLPAPREVMAEKRRRAEKRKQLASAWETKAAGEEARRARVPPTKGTYACGHVADKAAVDKAAADKTAAEKAAADKAAAEKTAADKAAADKAAAEKTAADKAPRHK